MLRPVKESDFEKIIQDNEIVFVDFWAEWCAPCKTFSKVYEQIAEKNASIFFATVNIEEEPKLAEAFSVLSIPHLIVFKKGIAIYSESGSMPESVLKELVDQALAVDVDRIKE